MTEITNLLNHKPQIILQGPPGTGKTYEAKNIAESLIRKDGKISENKKEQAEFLKKSEQFELIQFHPSYTYEDFVRGIIVNSDNGNYETQDKVLAEFAKKALDDKDKKYILVVDEINRANLPSVLGELIYALEYRDEVVTSMYEKDGDGGKIILPSNLYIIGTMNTADRSVGHIDYAIRRRFAFVDMLPDIAVITNPEAKILFKEVEKIFDNHLATDFQKNDVQLGHSYFLVKNEDELSMRLNYEILPILREYLKDGIFLQEAEKAIENLVR
jgi:5-methylcytosine-specific restriction endonuclease McrBC GTP-binding regulatory subunit McrB